MRSLPELVLGNAMTSRMESLAGEQHAHAVQTQREAAHRGRAVLEGVHQEAELLAGAPQPRSP